MKQCKECSKIKPLTDFTLGKGGKDGRRRTCKICTNYAAKIRGRKAYALDPEKFIKRAKVYHQTLMEKDPERSRAVKRNYNRRQRLIALQKYGGTPPKCACCKESEIKFLAIDHINNDGAEHRRKCKMNLHIWLKKHNYPKGFQILCHNCNMAKGSWGICPHKT